MCQRRQKSCSDTAVYGESKFSGNWNPIRRAQPMAMSV